MDFIEHLRNKPLVARKRIAFALSATVTLVVFVLWVTVWRFNFEQNKTNQTASVGASAIATSSEVSSNPFGMFVEVFATGWQGLMNSFGQVNDEFKNVQNKIMNGTGEIISTSTSVSATSSDSIKITQ